MLIPYRFCLRSVKTCKSYLITITWNRSFINSVSICILHKSTPCSMRLVPQSELTALRIPHSRRQEDNALRLGIIRPYVAIICCQTYIDIIGSIAAIQCYDFRIPLRFVNIRCLSRKSFGCPCWILSPTQHISRRSETYVFIILVTIAINIEVTFCPSGITCR